MLEDKLDIIDWCLTVPAIAKDDLQVDFMKNIFFAALEKMKLFIEPIRVHIVREPQGGFMFYCKKEKDLRDKSGSIEEQVEQTVAIIDIGGGTIDITVTYFCPCREALILWSDYGHDTGGSHVDKKFMEDIETLTKYKEKAKMSHTDKSEITTVLSNIRD